MLILAVRMLASIALAISIAPGVSSAASITKSSQLGCAVSLQGEIVTGDFGRLAALAGDVGWLEPDQSGGDRIDEALCLDSPGGSYPEGRLIAHYVHQHGITTRVSDGAACFSACAFAFMAGRAHGPESDGPSRYLHVNGHLGFHAPYFDVAPDEAMTGADLAEKLRLSNYVLSDFIAFGSYTSSTNTRPMLSLSLLGEMLAAGPNELAMVNTIEDVARWRIYVEGQAAEAELNPQGIVQACINFQAWSLDLPAERVNPDDYLPFETVAGDVWGHGPVTFAVVDTSGMELRNCHVQITNGAAPGVAICSRNETNGMMLGDCPSNFADWVPWYYGMEPQMPLVELGRIGG